MCAMPLTHVCKSHAESRTEKVQWLLKRLRFGSFGSFASVQGQRRIRPRPISSLRSNLRFRLFLFLFHTSIELASRAVRTFPLSRHRKPNCASAHLHCRICSMFCTCLVCVRLHGVCIQAVCTSENAGLKAGRDCEEACYVKMYKVCTTPAGAQQEHMSGFLRNTHREASCAALHCHEHDLALL